MKNSLLKNLIILLAMVATCFVIISSLFNRVEDIADYGRPPLFATNTIDGKPVALIDLEGSPVIVHFWASWCTPCRKEFPELVKLATHHPELTILAISVDQTQAKIDEFIAAMPNADQLRALPNLLFIHDRSKQLSAELYKTTSYPESYIIGCNFRMVDKVIGPEMDWESRMAPWLERCKMVDNL